MHIIPQSAGGGQAMVPPLAQRNPSILVREGDEYQHTSKNDQRRIEQRIGSREEPAPRVDNGPPHAEHRGGGDDAERWICQATEQPEDYEHSQRRLGDAKRLDERRRRKQSAVKPG